MPVPLRRVHHLIGDSGTLLRLAVYKERSQGQIERTYFLGLPSISTIHRPNTTSTLMSPSLAGKVAIVTGSSRSIGAATATHLASLGANVVINYVSSASAAQAVADAINKQGVGKAIIVKADAGSIADNKHLVDETLKTFGRLDIVVLNAGLMDNQKLEDVTEEAFAKQFDTNVKGPLFLVQAAAKHMSTGKHRRPFADQRTSS